MKSSQIAVQILDTFMSLSLLWSLGATYTVQATYTVHLRLTGKLVVDFLLVLIELFSLGVMAEVL